MIWIQNCLTTLAERLNYVFQKIVEVLRGTNFRLSSPEKLLRGVFSGTKQGHLIYGKPKQSLSSWCLTQGVIVTGRWWHYSKLNTPQRPEIGRLSWDAEHCEPVDLCSEPEGSSILSSYNKYFCLRHPRFPSSWISIHSINYSISRTTSGSGTTSGPQDYVWFMDQVRYS